MLLPITEDVIFMYDYELDVLRSLSKSQLSLASRLANTQGWGLEKKTYGDLLSLANKIVQQRFGLVRSAPAPYISAVMAFIINAQKWNHYKDHDWSMLDKFLDSKPIYLAAYAKEEGGVGNEK